MNPKERVNKYKSEEVFQWTDLDVAILLQEQAKEIFNKIEWIALNSANEDGDIDTSDFEKNMKEYKEEVQKK